MVVQAKVLQYFHNFYENLRAVDHLSGKICWISSCPSATEFLTQHKSKTHVITQPRTRHTTGTTLTTILTASTYKGNVYLPKKYLFLWPLFLGHETIKTMQHRNSILPLAHHTRLRHHDLTFTQDNQSRNPLP